MVFLFQRGIRVTVTGSHTAGKHATRGRKRCYHEYLLPQNRTPMERDCGRIANGGGNITHDKISPMKLYFFLIASYRDAEEISKCR